MKPLLFLLCYILTCSVAVAGENRVLRTSGNASYPPSSWARNGIMFGVGAEVVRAIYKDRPVSVESNDLGPWARVQNAARLGKVDIVTTIYRTQDRERYLVFPQVSYMQDENVIFVRKGDAFPFASWKDLIGKKGGVVVGDSYGQALDALFGEFLKTEPTPTFGGNLEKLVAGRIQYIPYGRYAGMFEAMRKHLDDKIAILPTPLSSEGLYLAVSKMSPFVEDVPFIEDRLRELLADGTIDALIKKAVEQYLQQTNLKVH